MFHNLCVFGKCENTFGMFRCECRDGYKVDGSGGNCTDIDECESPQSCLYGECSNTQGSFHCVCPPHYELVAEGNACIDRRTSRCFLHADDRGRCSMHISDYVSKAACCCSVGQGWGPHCELCPTPDDLEYQQLCPGGMGYKPNDLTVVLEDINECEEHENICENGYCTNIFGSFMCSCNEGFRLDDTGFMCVDINECVENPGICNIGECVNEPGKYYCQCPEGYMPLPGRRECVDMRKDVCYLNWSRWQCSTPMTQNQTKKVCCCSMGQAWGHPCEPCPEAGTSSSGVCPHPGKCTNVMGSYVCTCPEGYELSAVTGICEDIDECVVNAGICEGGVCGNTEGGAFCTCPEGFILETNTMKCIDVRQEQCYDLYNRGQCLEPRGMSITAKECCCSKGAAWGRYCEKCPAEGSADFLKMCPEGAGRMDTGSDLNECELMPNVCDGGECVNTDGSFRCDCPMGYTLDETGKKCIDENECVTSSNVCGNGTCTNVIGGFECSCSDGFAPGPMQVCEDVNECHEIGNQCAFRCHNVPGSFRCICPYDRRLGLCYRQLINGRCRTPYIELKKATRADCCCSMGEAWGPQCELCPARFTPQYQELCLDSGFLIDGQDVNECETIPDLCNNGQCINTMGSYRCICNKGYRTDISGLYCLDINECEEIGICPKPGRCVNTLGSFKCICPRGFKLDSTGTYCLDADECADDSKCPEGCQNIIGGYRCGCPEGYVLHYYYNQCVDENECQSKPCGSSGTCFNTPGSYRCGCPDGYQFDSNLNVCIQVSAGCAGAPCAFGCTSIGSSYSCGCPQGYQRIGQGHCLSTITPAYSGYTQDIGDVPTYPIDDRYASASNDKLITTEGCFSCKVNGRHRRASRHLRMGRSSFNDTITHIFKRNLLRRRVRRHHHGEELELKIDISQTKHRMRIIKIQPSVKNEMFYTIVSGNEQKKFELVKKHGVWALHFRRRLKEPGVFDLVIHGRPDGDVNSENEVYEKPLTLRVRIIVTEGN
ncbi:hypothetical protein NQ318_013650 [Aromia moschata]|uniref:Fibrillin-2 n=1 Tax=Aromia moschata TaxID=1265417 RepID=A0AAV8Y184_9CUCU|nr:hypothetical protein NQ318_013650 [Aromia moschata]